MKKILSLAALLIIVFAMGNSAEAKNNKKLKFKDLNISKNNTDGANSRGPASVNETYTRKVGLEVYATCYTQYGTPVSYNSPNYQNCLNENSTGRYLNIDKPSQAVYLGITIK